MALILITGAHGFIGRHLVQRMAALGHEVCGLGHGAWPEAEARSSGMGVWLNGEIVSANLRLLQDRCGMPHHVVHLAGGSSVGAALANPREDFFRTVGTTAELLDWIRVDAPQATLLAISSAAVYGAGHIGPIQEDALLHPYSPYGYHKMLMEDLCRSYAENYGISVCVARLFSVYGPGLTKQLLWDLCSRLAAGVNPLTLGGEGEELRDWVDVRDVCDALSLLLRHASESAPTFNVGSGMGIPVRQVARLLADAWAGQDATPVPLKFSGLSRPGDPYSLVANPLRLQALGFDMRVPLGQGMTDYVSWYRQRSAGMSK